MDKEPRLDELIMSYCKAGYGEGLEDVFKELLEDGRVFVPSKASNSVGADGNTLDRG